MAAMMLYQQGSKGPMRDLDYINPRPPRQSSALPPEVRAKLLGRRASSCPPLDKEDDKQALYKGAANAQPKVGASGAGTNWHNPNGHAFVRKGSGLPRHVKRVGGYGGASLAKLAPDPNHGDRAVSRESAHRPPVAKGRVASKEAAGRSRASSGAAGEGGGYADQHRGGGTTRPPKAPSPQAEHKRPDSLANSPQAARDTVGSAPHSPQAESERPGSAASQAGRPDSAASDRSDA
eukprot:TRINITY_DN109535_c0_g1_i1.p1 TRINITY_DN109535_c0_g1~~TRINITY_DN109535_c0_g1_i1.p1  ORF type:complete len:244 (-),score=31.82 TRINITY_DN109535_c0_g1_i1:37-741(-)